MDDDYDVEYIGPENSIAGAVSATCGVLGIVLAVAGIVVLPVLLAVSAIVTGVVGLVRNEPSRVAPAVGLIAAVLVFL